MSSERPASTGQCLADVTKLNFSRLNTPQVFRAENLLAAQENHLKMLLGKVFSPEFLPEFV